MNLQRFAPREAVTVTADVYGEGRRFTCFTYRYLIFLDCRLKFAGGFRRLHGCVETCRCKPEQAPMTRDDSRRPLKVQVKSGRGRTLSSKLWLDRQLNDPYVARARREGFRSRA